MEAQLIVLTVLVLLPLIPAFLLFKLLPSGAVVKGPLKGLDVALSGAFGGYVALTVFVATFYVQTLRPKPVIYRTWRVSGQLQFPDGEQPRFVRGDLGRPLLDVDPAQFFTVEIPLREGAEVPNLVLQAEGYAPQSVKLIGNGFGTKPYKKTIDPKAAKIEFEEPIVFHKPPAPQAYNAPAAPEPAVISGGG